MCEKKSLYAHLMDLPKELLIEMLLCETKIHDKDDAYMKSRILSYDGKGEGKICVYETTVCGGCKKPLERRYESDDDNRRAPNKCKKCKLPLCYSEWCKYTHPDGYCRTCALQEGRPLCVSCNHSWGIRECDDCKCLFCSECLYTGARMGSRVCRECHIKRGTKFCDLCYQICRNNSYSTCLTCSKELCSYCARLPCSNKHQTVFLNWTGTEI